MTALFDKLPPHRPRDAAQAALLLQDIEAINVLAPLVDAHKDFFAWLVEGSPFLARLIRRYPDTLTALSGTPPEEYLADLYAALQADMEQVQDRDRAIATLRHARNRAALAVALADLADLWDVETVTDYLTRLADLAVCCGLIIYCARRQTMAV